MIRVVAFPSLDHEVLSLNPARGRIQLMTVWHVIALYDLNNVERDVKHPILIIKL